MARSELLWSLQIPRRQGPGSRFGGTPIDLAGRSPAPILANATFWAAESSVDDEAEVTE